MEATTLVHSPDKKYNLLAHQCLLMGNYKIEIFTSIKDLPEDWDEFAKVNQSMLETAVLGVPEKSSLVDINYFYVLVREKKGVIALFYFQNLTVRKDYYPDFSKLSFAAKNLYCLVSSNNYNLLINGHLFNNDIPGASFNLKHKNKEDIFTIFEKVVTKVKRESNSSILIIKDPDFSLEQGLLKIKRKYKSMPDDILMAMDIPERWNSVIDYIDSLSKKYAVRAKKIEESLQNINIEEFDVNQLKEHSNILQELYMNVISKSSFKMGILNMNYFIEMKLALRENFKFNVWKIKEQIVGFTTYIKYGRSLELYYIGYDYKLNKSYHLYQCMLQQGIKDAIAEQVSVLKLGRTAYEAKAIVGAKPLIKRNYFQISNPLLKIAYRYAADYFISENNTNWQVRNPFKESITKTTE